MKLHIRRFGFDNISSLIKLWAQFKIIIYERNVANLQVSNNSNNKYNDVKLPVTNNN